MTFELLPLLDKMIEYYQKPGGFERFREYLKLLTNKEGNDIDLPIIAFNPMGKEHVLEKLKELKELDAEGIIQSTLTSINNSEKNNSSRIFKVSISLADDLKGGWTNRFTTDYQSKFNQKSMTKRNFCLPLFWAGESYSVSLIKERTIAAIYRTIYQLNAPAIETLSDHLKQEHYVASHSGSETKLRLQELERTDLYKLHKETLDFPVIFNFLYGDKAAESLGYKTLGVDKGLW